MFCCTIYSIFSQNPFITESAFFALSLRYFPNSLKVQEACRTLKNSKNRRKQASNDIDPEKNVPTNTTIL